MSFVRCNITNVIYLIIFINRSHFLDFKKLTMQCFEEHRFGDGQFERKKREYGRKIRKIASEAVEEQNLYDIFVTSHDMMLNHVQVILKYK